MVCGVGFGCGSPHGRNESFISFWQELFERPRTYYDDFDLVHDYSHDYPDYSSNADWVQIYSQTYASFIYADYELFNNTDVVVIDTSGLEYVTDAERKKIAANIKKAGFSVVDEAYGKAETHLIICVLK